MKLYNCLTGKWLDDIHGVKTPVFRIALLFSWNPLMFPGRTSARFWAVPANVSQSSWFSRSLLFFVAASFYLSFFREPYLAFAFLLALIVGINNYSFPTRVQIF